METCYSFTVLHLHVFAFLQVSQCVLKKGERYISEYLDWVRNAVGANYVF